jgi:hypothetical protein
MHSTLIQTSYIALGRGMDSRIIDSNQQCLPLSSQPRILKIMSSLTLNILLVNGRRMQSSLRLRRVLILRWPNLRILLVLRVFYGYVWESVLREITAKQRDGCEGWTYASEEDREEDRNPVHRDVSSLSRVVGQEVVHNLLKSLWAGERTAEGALDAILSNLNWVKSHCEPGSYSPGGGPEGGAY